MQILLIYILAVQAAEIIRIIRYLATGGSLKIEGMSNTYMVLVMCFIVLISPVVSPGVITYRIMTKGFV